jgi:glycosyltransferase involved in cell wall biosynthesis
LSTVLGHYPESRERPRLVYVSHNHEESLRRKLVGSRVGYLRRQAQHLDAIKVARLERALVRAADLVTAITPEDGALYRTQWPDKPIAVLPPGYAGRIVPERIITADMPRRAVIVGSFDWIAKRMNLEEFVRIADPIFAALGIELQVVGSGDPSYFDQLGQGLRATRFTGTVEHVESYLDAARIAVVPERMGGGFKLKVLEYVFNRLPVLALNGSVAGVPLRDRESIFLFSDTDALARGVSAEIDDLDRLNRLQNAAFAACGDAFDWNNRGRQFLAALEAL